MRRRGNQGKAWEAMLTAWHGEYRARGRGVVVKADPPVKMLGKPDRAGRFLACFAGVGPADYLGVLDGVAVVFDAKETAQDRWAFGSSLKPHQIDMLRDSENAGAAAFVALRMGRRDLVVPWPVLERKLRALRAARGPFRTRRAPPGVASATYEELCAAGAMRMDARGYIHLVSRIRDFRREA